MRTFEEICKSFGFDPTQDVETIYLTQNISSKKFTREVLQKKYDILYRAAQSEWEEDLRDCFNGLSEDQFSFLKGTACKRENLSTGTMIEIMQKYYQLICEFNSLE